VIRIYRRENVTAFLHKQGARLRSLVNRAIREHHLEGRVEVAGRDCNLVFVTRDGEGNRSQPYRTLFMQELIRGGDLGPTFVVSFSHHDAEIDRTAEVVENALATYRKALSEGPGQYLAGRPVKPVFRKFN
jgi:glutamate-1-semialdehyde 2,1-aminomutase